MGIVHIQTHTNIDIGGGVLWAVIIDIVGVLALINGDNWHCDRTHTHTHTLIFLLPATKPKALPLRRMYIVVTAPKITTTRDNCQSITTFPLLRHHHQHESASRRSITQDATYTHMRTGVCCLLLLLFTLFSLRLRL